MVKLRDGKGRYTTQRRALQAVIKRLQLGGGLLILIFYLFLLVVPQDMYNAHVGTQTIHAAQKHTHTTPSYIPPCAPCACPPHPTTPPTQMLVDLIKNTFPEDPITACAIAYGESLSNPYGINRSDWEYSVGIMQINLLEPSTGKHVHWKKVAGNTLAEKTAWLQIPENNLKVARHIYDQQGWTPWGAYTNKSYLSHIEKCK